MKVLVKFNKNISTPKQIKTFKVFNIGEVISNINDLLNDSIIEIDNETLPIIKLKEDNIYKYYLINDLGKTPNLIYPYYTDDFTKDITIDDLILIKSNSGDANVQSDWNQSDNTKADYIKNKPFIPQNLSDLNNDLNLFSGDYNDLSNLPALFSGNYNDLSGLPTLFSGNYNDLSGIPSSFNPSSHGHLIGDISGLSTALNQKLDDAPIDGSTYGRKDGAWSALGSNSGGDIVYNIGIASQYSFGGWGISTGGWMTPPREICSITSVTACGGLYNGTTITDGRIGKLLIPSGYKLKEIKYYASESGTSVSQTLRLLAFNITSGVVADLQTIAHLNYTSQVGIYESNLTLDVTTELTRKYITFALNIGNNGNTFQQGIISIILTKA